MIATPSAVNPDGTFIPECLPPNLYMICRLCNVQNEMRRLRQQGIRMGLANLSRKTTISTDFRVYSFVTDSYGFRRNSNYSHIIGPHTP